MDRAFQSRTTTLWLESSCPRVASVVAVQRALTPAPTSPAPNRPKMLLFFVGYLCASSPAFGLHGDVSGSSSSTMTSSRGLEEDGNDVAGEIVREEVGLFVMSFTAGFVPSRSVLCGCTGECHELVEKMASLDLARLTWSNIGCECMTNSAALPARG